MSSFHENSMPTKIEMGALSKAIFDVITARNNNDVNGLWTGLSTLYYIYPGKGIEELSKKVDPILDKFQKIYGDGITYGEQKQNFILKQQRFKMEYNDKLFIIIFSAMRENGYLELVLGAKPRYEKKGHLAIPT